MEGDKPMRQFLSVAPMLDVTDRHFRYLMRLLTRRTRLYTEMVVDQTIIYNVKERERFLGFDDSREHPLAIQLGGNDPVSLAEVTSICQEWGYDEVNLNVGCPSRKVSGHCFGARLMLDPPRVRECVDAMRKSTKLPVTVKCRLGADDRDSYEELKEFISTVSGEGTICSHFIVHARKCILKGLSTSQNRSIPPLKHDWVFDLARDFPGLRFSINGGVTTLKEARDLLDPTLHDGIELNSVMIGRAAWHNPWIFADADRYIFGDVNSINSRLEVINMYVDYASDQVERHGDEGKATDFGPANMLKPILGIFHETYGAGNWRKIIHDEIQINKNMDLHDIVDKALKAVSEEAMNERPPM